MWYTTYTFLLLACLAPTVLGQFQFFEHMFGQGQHPGHQQRQPNHAPQWAAQADAGMYPRSLREDHLADSTYFKNDVSTLFRLSVSRDTGLRAQPLAVPLPKRGGRQMSHPRY